MNEHTYFFNKIFKWQLYSTLYIGIIQLVTIILLGRFLPYKELGAFAIFQIVFRFALYTLDPGMFFSIIQKHEYSNSLIKFLFSKQSLYILFSILALFAISQFTNTFSEIPLLVILNCYLIILLIGFGSYAQSRLVVDYKQKEIVIAQMMAYSFELIFVLFLCIFYNPMIIFTFGVITRFLIFYSICYYFNNKKNHNQSLIPEEINRSSHIAISKYNIWSQILSFVQGQYDTIIIIALFGLPILGGYILVTEISYMIFAKLNPLFNKAIIPVISKAYKQKEETSNLISESFISYTYIIVILYFTFWNFRTELFQLAYPEKFKDLTYYATFLIPIALFKAMNNILTSYLLALGESKRIFYWNIAILTINYLILIFFYLTNGRLEDFLLLGLLYGLVSLVIVFYFVRIIFLNKYISWTGVDFKFITVLIVIIVMLYLIKLFVLNSLLALIFSLVSTFLILFFLERKRLNNWFKLSIV